jgi:dihydropyrimidinase
LPLLFNYGVMEGRITPERYVELTSTAPAKLVSEVHTECSSAPLIPHLYRTRTSAEDQYGLYPKKGALMPGLSDADLVVW